MKKALLLGAAASMALASSAFAAEELRIGFINTFSGGAAILGKEQMNGFMLGLEKEGWKKDGDKLGGVPMKLIVGDDQRKPDVAVGVARKMISSDRVDIVAGLFWSNILMAVQRPVTRAGRLVVTTNAGAAPMAGKTCNKLFVSTSFNNDQFAESLGQLMVQEGIKSVYMLAPNYQGGKDMFAGFKRTYKGGKVVGETLFKLGQKDFQAYISRVRAAKPEGVFLFAPGGMGIAFVKQWHASGANKEIKLFTVATVEYLSLNAIGAAAVGTFHTGPWDSDADNPAKQEFIKAFIAKHGRHPSFYAANAYDAPRLIAAALRKLGGKPDNMVELSKAMRHVDFASVRNGLSFNVNGVPIQNWYKREVVAGNDGKPVIKTTGVVLHNQKDSYWKECPEDQRL